MNNTKETENGPTYKEWLAQVKTILSATTLEEVPDFGEEVWLELYATGLTASELLMGFALMRSE